MAPLLDAGDILAHPFTRHPGGFVDKTGRMHPIVAEALKMGLRTDVGYGSHFSIAMCRKVLETGFVPDTLGADMHGYNTPVPPPPGTPVPTLPKTLPDPRSLFVGMVYSFTQLPEVPMATREVDPRVGHFFDTVTDLTTDLVPNPKRYLVNRWRLEKADPNAALSEPKQPIVFWLDKNIPEGYRAAVTEGILEWN